jgi:hypothetical protein
LDFEEDLLNTKTLWFFDKCPAMGNPMTPSPIKPMALLIQ